MQSRSGGQSAVVSQAPPPANMHCRISAPFEVVQPDSMQTEPTVQSPSLLHKLSVGHDLHSTLVTHAGADPPVPPSPPKLPMPPAPPTPPEPPQLPISQRGPPDPSDPHPTKHAVDINNTPSHR
ncbi:MAG: hypothetical protein PVH21_14685 [Myxococcales bacterium]